MPYRWTSHRYYDAAGNDTAGPSALSLWWLARAAAEETLQGSPLTTPWLKLFRSHLSTKEGHWLQWAGDMAESAELRRAYSGLYGRFAARALLTSHLGFSRFVSLKRNGLEIPGSIKVERSKRGDIPDWLAWDDRAGRYVLCEAKGSLTANDFDSPGTPKCVQEGKAQFGRVSCTGPSGPINPACWVAASRWATDDRKGRAASLLWDPPTDHDQLSEEAKRWHRRAITQAWLDSIAPGLGWRDASELLAERRETSAIVVRAEPGAVPTEEDWPTSVTSTKTGSEQVTAYSDDPGTSAEHLASTLSVGSLYNEGWTRSDRPTETSPLEKTYVSALITPFGVRPIHDLVDFDALERVQDQAREREQPAMLVGIPLGLDSVAPISESLWLDGAGIARSGDLAVFDLRRIEVQRGGIKLPL